MSETRYLDRKSVVGSPIIYTHEEQFSLLAIEYAVFKHKQGWDEERIKQGFLDMWRCSTRETKKEQG